MLFWKDVGERDIVRPPTPVQITPELPTTAVFYSRVARNLLGSREKQCGDDGDDLNTAVGISLPRWSGNAVIVTALLHCSQREVWTLTTRELHCPKSLWYKCECFYLSFPIYFVVRVHLILKNCLLGDRMPPDPPKRFSFWTMSPCDLFWVCSYVKGSIKMTKSDWKYDLNNFK